MTLSRVLFVHNRYLHRGGEDSVVDSEIALLEDNGHAVELFERSSTEWGGNVASAAKKLVWNSEVVSDFERRSEAFRPDVVHVHNTFPTISPAVYWAAARQGVPVVQTLHNFRLLCPQAMLLRGGRVCEDCIGRIPWRAAAHRCYRGSSAYSAALAGMVTVHRAIGTWRHKVTRYIALNAFCRDVFVRGGLPEERLCIKPNFVESPAVDAGSPAREGFLFVGRLSPEKGVDVLAKALAGDTGLRCEVVGTGPQENLVAEAPAFHASGWCDSKDVARKMLARVALVMPSVWYENFPRTLVEAFACGLPVIASRLGAMASIIDDGRTGLLFRPGDPEDLREKLHWAATHVEEMASMGREARAEYERHYTPRQNYEQLTRIYGDAIREVRGHG